MSRVVWVSANECKKQTMHLHWSQHSSSIHFFFCFLSTDFTAFPFTLKWIKWHSRLHVPSSKDFFHGSAHIVLVLGHLQFVICYSHLKLKCVTLVQSFARFFFFLVSLSCSLKHKVSSHRPQSWHISWW